MIKNIMFMDGNFKIFVFTLVNMHLLFVHTSICKYNVTYSMYWLGKYINIHI